MPSSKRESEKRKISRPPSPTTVFARVSGTLEFECPNCRVITRAHVGFITMRVRCGNSRCRRKYVVGLRIFAALPGSHFRPHPDHVPTPFRDWHPGPHEPPARDSGSLDRERNSPAPRTPPWLPAEATGPPTHRNDPRNELVELPVDEDDETEFERAASEATSEIVAKTVAGTVAGTAGGEDG